MASPFLFSSSPYQRSRGTGVRSAVKQGYEFRWARRSEWKQPTSNSEWSSLVSKKSRRMLTREFVEPVSSIQNEDPVYSDALRKRCNRLAGPFSHIPSSKVNRRAYLLQICMHDGLDGVQFPCIQRRSLLINLSHRGGRWALAGKVTIVKFTGVRVRVNAARLN